MSPVQDTRLTFVSVFFLSMNQLRVSEIALESYGRRDAKCNLKEHTFSVSFLIKRKL